MASIPTTPGQRLRAIAGSDDDSFVELVRKSGLNPKADFRHADLSRADLRWQDMRAFDLTNASLRGALVLGAQFNSTVHRRQLAEATDGVPAVVIPIGARLLALRDQIKASLGPHVLVPDDIVSALPLLRDEPDRRQRRTGAYIGDHTDLVRRRLSRHFKALSRTLKASGACFLLVEPDADLDFDILTVVRGYLRRDGVRSFAFIFPQIMGWDATGASLASARLRTLPHETWADGGLAGQRSGAATTSRPAAKLLKIDQARQGVIDLIWVVSNATNITIPSPSPTRRRLPRQDHGPVIRFGARKGRQSIADAVSAEAFDIEDFYALERFHVFLREDLFTGEAASIVTSRLGGRRVKSDFSTYPAREGLAPEYFLVAGADDSEVWATLGRSR